MQSSTNLHVPYRAGFQENERRKKCLAIHTVTCCMNTPHCLLGAGWPGPTLAPALSNTRCRSPSAAGAGGCGVSVCACLCMLVGMLWCFCAHGRERVVIVVDEFIIKDMAASTLSPLLSHCIVTNRPHEAWQPGRHSLVPLWLTLSLSLCLLFFFSYIPIFMHEQMIN